MDGAVICLGGIEAQCSQGGVPTRVIEISGAANAGADANIPGRVILKEKIDDLS